MNLTTLKETDNGGEVRRIERERGGFKRPILMEVRTTNMKILRKKNKLRGTEIYVKEDHTKEVQKQRKDLVKFMKIAWEQEHEATLMYNNLKINGRMYTLEHLDGEEKYVSNQTLPPIQKEQRVTDSRMKKEKKKRRKRLIR